MTNDEIAARLKVLEVLNMTALGLYLANTKNDPDYSKANALLDYIRASISAASGDLSPAGIQEAQRYGSKLTEILASNLRNMRGEGGQVQ